MAARPLRSTALALLVGSLLGGFVTAAPPLEASAGVIYDAAVPADVRAVVAWAVDLFERAEMALPRIDVHHHGDDTRRCSGRVGRHVRRGPVSVVDLCTTELGFATQVMVLHELAHAWIDHEVDDATRAAFRELRGYTHWRDYEAARWHENGTEQAAEIVVWGLVDRPMAMVRIHANSCDELEAGWWTLTGRPPLHGWRDECDASVAVALEPAVDVVGADAEQQARLDDALARFRAQGLELPDLDVHFHDDEADCAGHLGLFRPSFTPWRLSICSDLAFVPTHELAHAWEAANLDDEARARYLAVRGLASWDDPAAPWKDRGVEDAAFVIQQNLMATDPPPTTPEWAERIAAYELLVGRPSPLRGDDHDPLGGTPAPPSGSSACTRTGARRGGAVARERDRAGGRDRRVGLVDRPMAMVRIHGNSCDELGAGWRTPTGRPPLHGLRDQCDA